MIQPSKCPLCGAIESGRLHLAKAKSLRNKDEHVDKQWVRCDACRLVRVEPMPTDKDLQYYYETSPEGYSPMKAGRLWRALARSERLWWRLAFQLPSTGKLLEVGSSWGAFLAVAKYHGWEVRGLEASQRKVKWAQNMMGIDVDHGTAPLDMPDGPFDVIVAWEVIEHLREPREFLAYARKRLASDGILAVSSPCLDHPYHLAHMTDDPMWTVPSHLVYFDRQTMGKALKAEGFLATGRWFSESHYGSVCTVARRTEEP